MNNDNNTADQAARFAFFCMHPDATREDYERRLKRSLEEQGDDLAIRIKDCENCLENGSFAPDTSCRDDVVEARGFFKGMKRVIDEIAADPSVILT